MARKTIGLALSGGAARGVVHIGVVQALVELGIPVDCVAGTSAGSIVGALVAAAVSPHRMAQLAKLTRWRDVVRPTIPRMGLLDTRRLEAFLEQHLGRRDIEDLALPYAAVACDLGTGLPVVLTSGPLAAAVRASCAVPGLFSPVELGGRLLVDGGVCNNLPCDVPRSLGADLVIGVDLSARLAPVRLRSNVFSVVLRSLEIMHHNRMLHAGTTADVLIRPPVQGLSLVDLDSVEAYIRVGWEATMAQREALLDLKERARGRTLFEIVDPRRWLPRRTQNSGR